MRYQFVDSNKKTWPVRLMCKVLNVSSSGFYEWCKRPESTQDLSNKKLDEEICEVFEDHKQRYGVPPVTVELKDRGHQCSENRVARRMTKLGFKAVQAKKFKRTTDSNHDKPIAPDLIEQDFTALAPNLKWVSDLTYIWTGGRMA